MNYVRRFVFVHYEDLLEVRFRQLEKVTDKLYVFVPQAVEQVPMWLVRQMQDMGRDLTWVTVGDATYEQAQLLMSFQVGSLHESVDPGVEFAILSDSESIDVLAAHLQSAVAAVCASSNAAGVALRQARERLPTTQLTTSVKTPSKRPSQNQNGSGHNGSASHTDVLEDDEDELDHLDLELEDLDAEVAADHAQQGAPTADKQLTAKQEGADLLSELGRVRKRDEDETAPATAYNKQQPSGKSRGGRREPLHSEQSREELEAVVTPLADEVVRKLIRSGNRPNELSMLRSYILLHSSEAEAVRYVDDIIARMRRKGEIVVDGNSVKYTF